MKLNQFLAFASFTTILVTIPSLSSHALGESSPSKISTEHQAQSIQNLYSLGPATGNTISKNCCLGEGSDRDSKGPPADVDIDVTTPLPAPPTTTPPTPPTTDPPPEPSPNPTPPPEPSPDPDPDPDPDPEDELIRRYYECWTNGNCEGVPGGNGPIDTGDTGDTNGPIDTGDSGSPTTDSDTGTTP